MQGDISVIIPTYNRVDDLKALIDSLKKQVLKPKEIIIVDDSSNDKIKDFIENLNRKKYNIFYRKKKTTEKRGITTSRNIGFAMSSGNIISFLDDDVVLSRSYMKDLEEFYNAHPQAKGICFVESAHNKTKVNKFNNFLMKCFFLGYAKKNYAKVLPSMVHTNPVPITQSIESEFLSGENFSFRREVLKKIKFDEHFLEYAPQEDLDFTFRVNKKYPKSMFFVPKSNFVHNVSQVGRMNIKRLIYHRMIYLAYMFRKSIEPNVKNYFIFWWSLFGRILLRTLNLLNGPNKENFEQLYHTIMVTCSILFNFRELKKNPNYFKKTLVKNND